MRAATATETETLDLSGLLLSGATYHGRAVTEIVIRWDGGELRATLTPPDDAESENGSDTRQRRIVEALRASPVALSRKQLAKILRLKTVGGRFSQDVSRLVGNAEIVERNHLLTDDATKFPNDDCDED